MDTGLSDLAGTRWSGTGEIWLDPLGNDAQSYECTLAVHADSLSYRWNFDGAWQEGSLRLTDRGATWIDTWHSPEEVQCVAQPDDWSLLALSSTYSAGDGPDWGWHTRIAQRPSGELVLQMTNVTPWGEQGRAVRMVFSPAAADTG